MEIETQAKLADAQGDHISAIVHYLEAFERIRSSSEKDFLQFKAAKMLHRVGDLYSEMGDLKNAIDYYTGASNLYTGSGVKLMDIFQGLADCNSSVGVCYMVREQYKLAFNHFKKAVEYNQQTIEYQEDSLRHLVVDKVFFNYGLCMLCLFKAEIKAGQILNFLKKVTKFKKKYDVKGFGYELCILFSQVLWRDMRNARMTFKTNIEKSIALPLNSAALRAIVMSWIVEFALERIPGAQPWVQEEEQFDEKGEVVISRRIYEDMLLCALTYANRRMPAEDYREIIVLLIGSVKKDNVNISEIVPMTVGTESEVRFDDEHYIKAAEIDAAAAERNEFIVGWYHTHPGLGLFLSPADIINQLGYQSSNEKAIAIVFDFTLMTPARSGFEIFRLDSATAFANYHTVRWRVANMSKEFYVESVFFFNKFLASANNLLAKQKEMSFTQLAQELNRSELLLEIILPQLIDSNLLPQTSYDLETKMVSRTQQTVKK